MLRKRRGAKQSLLLSGWPNQPDGAKIDRADGFERQRAKVRAIQRFIGESTWNADKMMHIYRSMLDSDMGEENGVLIIDESGFRKKGNDSAGVYKQYCGNIGKVDNCRVGVFAAYASSRGYALSDRELFVPEAWFGDEYEERRNKCRFPADLQFRTKPQISARMVNDIVERNQISMKYVVADSIYGNSPEFIRQVERYIGRIYFLAVPGDTKCWPKMPATAEKEYRHRGEIRKKTVSKQGEGRAVSPMDLAKGINSYFRYRRKVSEGSKGPIEYEFSKRRVVLAKKGLPTKEIRLTMKRTLGLNPTYSFFIGNAPLSADLSLFVRLSGVRWPTEQCFEEGKSELGMDRYEVRKYLGWNRHMPIGMLSHFFLWHLKIKLGKKSTGCYCCPA